MNLNELSVTQLDKLLRAAEAECLRRSRRRPPAVVRDLLQRAVVEAGYAWADVFPEWPTAAVEAPRPPLAPVAESTPTARQHLGVPVTSRSPAEPLSTALRIVRNLQARDAYTAHMSVSLETLVAELDAPWPLFHAAMEEANRRGWVHFRGNAHCVLTADGNGVDR